MKIQSIQTFGAPTINDYYRAADKEVKEKIQNHPNQKLIGTDTDELTQFLMQEYALSPLEIDEQRQIEYEKLNKKVEVTTMFDDIVTQDKTLLKLIFPIKPGINIADSLTYFTQSHVVKSFNFDYDDNLSTIAVEGEPEAAAATIQEITTIFSQRTAEIKSQNEQLEKSIRDAIEQRKKKIMQDNESFEAIMQKVPIPLKQRNEAPTYQVPLQARNDIKRLTIPTSTTPKRPELSQELLASIIKAIDVDGRNFENAPETYTQLTEPDLRNIIVGHLNHYFPDDATGESFVKLGKADIRLKVFEGEILIAECKYWGGEEEYHKAINQLFRYLTWRYNYGLIIIFSRNQGFTDVLETIKESTQKHPSYKGGFTILDKHHFCSIHNFPEDPKKQVEIHISAYNLYFKKDENA